MAHESYRFVVTGKVQGVFFRQSTVRVARQLALDGWVRNLPDGRVEGLARGEPAPLRQLRDWLGQGPRLARVEQVQWQPSADIPAPGFAVFE